MGLRIGIIGNRERARIEETLDRLLLSLKSIEPASCLISNDLTGLATDTEGCSYAPDHYTLARESDVIFALGGDGTMLGAARAIIRANPETKLLGVNLGKLGFIAENPPEEIDRLVSGLRDGSLINEERLVVSATVESERNPTNGVKIKHDGLDPDREGKAEASLNLVALNEVVLDNFGSTRMLTFEVYVNDALLGIMRADGIIVASPTGSTGYAVSAGGPIMEPTSPVMLITPIAPHSLSVRPIIVPESSRVVIRARSDETKQALVVADGQEEAVVDTPAMVTISSCEHKLNLLRLADNSYFDLLRAKMFWSIDPVEGNRGRR